MYLSLTPQAAVCSVWHPCWPRPGQNLLRIRYSSTFPISHPSTRLCLELLKLACRERPCASLLDVGCGSGILALAGAMLGVPLNVGCDLSAAAVRVSQDNARRHHLTHRVFCLQGSTEALRPAFHLIMANLPFPVQMVKKWELLRLVHPQGGLILSGFRDTQEKDIVDFYLSRGWRLHHRFTRDLWELELPAERSYTWVGLYLGPATV
jgi:ribosomal protein L11 methyltransferase